MPESSELPIQEVAASTPEPPAPNVVIPPNPEMGESQVKNVELMIVFGQGPIKPLLREIDLDPAMKERWDAFKSDPLHNDEPDFRVIEGEAWTNQLKGLTEEQAQIKIAQWQNQGRFGLNRWGRENALATGFALVSGYTENALLSGGKTIPGWAKDKLPPGRIESWPSEAQLMADIIIRRFGPAYQKKFGRPIESALIREDASTNTLENFANSINQNPELLDDKTNIGLLAADFHVSRSEKIAVLFESGSNIGRKDGAQELLESRVRGIKDKEVYRKILNWMTDPDNPDLQKRIAGEKRFMTGLEDPQYINYWLGYIGLAEDPRVLQETIRRFGSDPKWSMAAKAAFETAGLSYDELSGRDLTVLPQEDFNQIAQKLTILTKDGYRIIPPPVAS